MYELIVKGDFSASHFVRGHQGKCKNLHGHTWKVEIVVVADGLNEMGMVVDFSDIKGNIKEILAVLDHSHLNEVPPFDTINPTSENLAKYLFEEFTKKMPELKFKRVTVWESDKAGASYSL